jgi:hypothetical protein
VTASPTATAATPEEPREEIRVKTGVDIRGFVLPAGLARGFIALWLVGTLILVQFVSKSATVPALQRVLETLVVAVIAFYFGGRRSKAPRVHHAAGSEAQGTRVRSPVRSQAPTANEPG